MAIRLLALDIDGTLLNPRGEITPRTRSALDEVQRRGILVALVTGRRFGSARPVVLELGLSVPLVSHNGALTKNVSTLDTIGFHPLDIETAREVIRIGRDHGTDMICCDDPNGLGVMVIDGVSPENRALHRYLDKYRDSLREVPDLLEYLDHAPIQIMFSGSCDPIDDFADQLQQQLDGRIQLFKTRYRSVDLTIGRNQHDGFEGSKRRRDCAQLWHRLRGCHGRRRQPQRPDNAAPRRCGRRHGQCRGRTESDGIRTDRVE